MGIPVIGLTDRGGGELAALCTVMIEAASTHTARIQEDRITTYHALCPQIEEHLFGREAKPWRNLLKKRLPQTLSKKVIGGAGGPLYQKGPPGS